METTIMGHIGYIFGLYWDNVQENGNYYIEGRRMLLCLYTYLHESR